MSRVLETVKHPEYGKLEVVHGYEPSTLSYGESWFLSVFLTDVKEDEENCLFSISTNKHFTTQPEKGEGIQKKYSNIDLATKMHNLGCNVFYCRLMALAKPYDKTGEIESQFREQNPNIVNFLNNLKKELDEV